MEEVEKIDGRGPTNFASRFFASARWYGVINIITKISFMFYLLLFSNHICRGDSNDLFPCPPTFDGGLNHEPMSSLKRTELAQTLLKANEHLHRELPELSPSEIKWLNTELAAGGQRMFAAFFTVEHNKREAKQFTKTREVILMNLVTPGKMELRDQVRLWSILAGNYNQMEFAQAVASLAEQNVIDSKILPKVEPQRSLDCMCRMQGDGILSHIVIPFLGNELRE